MTDSQLLEDRITSLERKIYGLEKLVTMDDDTVFETSVIDNLLHANTLISSALSGREKANAAIKRLPELSDYLNPNYEESLLPTEAKLQLIMTMEPEIRENHQLYSKMQELLPVLETSRLKDVPELSHKLNDLTVTYLQTYERTKDLTNDVNDIFSKYNTVMDSISKSLITLDAAVTAAEIAAMPKKHIDD